MWVIVLIISVVLIWKYFNSSEESVDFRIHQNKYVFSQSNYDCNIEYLGGHPELLDSCKYRMKFYDDHIAIANVWKNEAVEINYNDINNLERKTDTHIFNNPKLSSIVIFGAIGLAINNKEKEDTYSFVMNFKYKNKNIDIIFKPIDDLNGRDSKQTFSRISSIMNMHI